MNILGREKSGTTFYCFSPLVMAATFLIEAALLVYVIMRYKLSASGRAIVAILACLASFQLAEYMVCEGSPSTASNWASFGFVVITFLPPLGLYLVNTIRPSRAGKRALFAAFSLAALFSVYFIVTPDILTATCTGNYVIFNIPEPYNVLHGFYYYLVVFGSLLLARQGMHGSKSGNKRSLLKWYIIGILAFFIPSGIVGLLNLDAMQALPSIMCGFALILALILAFKIAPEILRKRS